MENESNNQYNTFHRNNHCNHNDGMNDGMSDGMNKDNNKNKKRSFQESIFNANNCNNCKNYNNDEDTIMTMNDTPTKATLPSSSFLFPTKSNHNNQHHMTSSFTSIQNPLKRLKLIDDEGDNDENNIHSNDCYLESDNFDNDCHGIKGGSDGSKGLSAVSIDEDIMNHYHHQEQQLQMHHHHHQQQQQNLQTTCIAHCTISQQTEQLPFFHNHQHNTTHQAQVQIPSIIQNQANNDNNNNTQEYGNMNKMLGMLHLAKRRGDGNTGDVNLGIQNIIDQRRYYNHNHHHHDLVTSLSSSSLVQPVQLQQLPQQQQSSMSSLSTTASTSSYKKIPSWRQKVKLQTNSNLS
jgi:hypothetical protein